MTRIDWTVMAGWVCILGADLIALYLFFKGAALAWRFLQ